MFFRACLSASTALLLVSCASSGEPETARYAAGPSKAAPPVEAASARPADDAILPYEATETTLDNGLRVIVVPTGMPNLVSVQIPVQVGSRNEIEAGKTGFAHFFEHMMFRGTEQYPPHEYEAIITRAGARQNAYTTDDYTNYHVTFAKEDLEQVLEIEADRFQNLKYTDEQFRTEALAVLGEYNKNVSSPIRKMLEVIRDEAYTTHTYKHTTMGFLADIEAMPDQGEYAKTFFDRFYRPEYTTVIVAGDVDAEDVVPMVEKYWGGWKRGTYQAAVPAEPVPRGPTYAHVPWEQDQNYVCVAFHGPAFSETEADSAAIDILFELFFGSTSDLYNRLVVSEQKVDQLFTHAPDSQDPSLKYVFARVNDAADALYVRDAILATLEEARTDPVAEKRLEDAKSNLRYGVAASFDSTDSIAGTLAAYVRFARSFDTLNNVFEVYAGLSTDDLLEAGGTYITDDRLVVCTLSQQPLDPAMGGIPALASFGLSGDASAGSDLAFLEQPSPSKQLSIKLLFRSGSADDPVGKEGLAALSAAMIADAGSADMTYEEIQKTLFPISGGFGAQVDREMTVFNGGIHADNFRIWAGAALAQLTAPGFRDEDFERVKTNLRNSLVQDLCANNDEELGKEVLQRVVFAGTPYGHPSQGTVAGIDAITLDDVRQFVATHYSRGNLMVGVAGDMSDEVEARLRGQLSTLPGGAPEQPAEPTGRTPDGIEVTLVQKDDARATAISFGFPIEVTRAHPDYPALYLARTWLGEHRSSMSHLYQRIREVRGMNYGDYAYIEAFPGGMFRFFPSANIARQAQIFEIWIRPVPPEQGHHALRIAIHELEQLVQNGLTQDEFESTREYLSKNVFLLTSTQSSQLGYALDSDYYGIDDYPTYMRTKLAELTVDDVNAVIEKHLQAANLDVVMIVDDADGLKAALVADTPSSIEYASEKPAELLAEDEVIGARKLDIDADDVTIVAATDVFAQ